MADMNITDAEESWYDYITNERAFDALDPRVENWPLTGLWTVPTQILPLYILFVWFGPKFMKNRKPMDLKFVMTIYNITMVFLSAFEVTECMKGILEVGFMDLCQPLKRPNTTAEMKMVNTLWLCYITRVIELLDTVFIILKKKENQLSFLHVYHHASVLVFGWAILRWISGGSVIFAPMVNSVVHTVMYAYYALSAFGPTATKFMIRKKYITVLQLAQFVFGFIASIYIYRKDCGFPWPLTILGGVYVGGYIILFGDFYLKTYLRKRRQDSDSKLTKSKENSLCNGHNGIMSNGNGCLKRD